jgi:hypothetical protein
MKTKLRPKSMQTHTDCKMSDTYIGSNMKDLSGQTGLYKRPKTY